LFFDAFSYLLQCSILTPIKTSPDKANDENYIYITEVPFRVHPITTGFNPGTLKGIAGKQIGEK
jgi:hypothetical protein